ncbi:hypothetical protein ENUP19_0162G0001 [Entamoeba nuttalli]|uniref:J domain-containing protein n=2 Tax=Entamoeba nuttalli TaxID=412467 RepID=A0ABQ0DLS9_9EUKA
MSELSKYPTGSLSIKFFSQVTEKRVLVKRVRLIANKDLQMCISKDFVALLTSGTYELIEVWEWPSITEISCTENADEFIVKVNGKKQKLISTARSYVICILQEYKYKVKPTNYMSFSAEKIYNNGKIKEVNIQIRPYGIVEVATKICLCTDSQGVAIIKEGNERIVYSFNDRGMAASEIVKKCDGVGIKMTINSDLTMEEVFNGSNIKKAEEEEGGSLVEIKANHGIGKREKIICFTEMWFVEREASNYTVTFAKPLNEIIHILRGQDAMEIIITFSDGLQKHFFTTQREQFIASLFDCAIAAKADPIISDIPRFGSLIIERMTIAESGQIETSILKNLANFDGSKIVDLEAKELFMVFVFLLNNNTSINGPQIADSGRSKLIGQALEKMIVYGKAGEGFLQCVYRLLSTRMGYETFVQNKNIMEKLVEIIGKALESVKPIILFWGLRICGLMLCSTAEENTEKKGKLAVMKLGLHEKIFNTLKENIKKGSPFVIYGCVTTLKYIVCEPYSNTTEFNMFNQTMSLIGSLGRDLFMLFQSPCISIPHIAGQMLQTLVEETDMEEKIKELQDYALLEGITLQYFYTASLHLLDVFTFEHIETESTFKRILPYALLKYLEEEEEPPEQIDGIDSEKRKGVKQQQMNKALAFWKKWNSERHQKGEEIRTRQKHIKQAKRNWSMLIYQIHQQHRRADLIWNNQTLQELKEALDNEIRQLKKDQEEGEVAWNYREFIVEYHSLDNEVCVDGCFIRCLLEKGEITLSDPRDFFDTLYHRCLFETNRELQALAIQAMSVIYRKFNKEIGAFKDISHIVSMLRMTRSLLLRDRLIELLDSLLKVEINARTFIDVGGIDLYVDLLILVHLHSDHAIIPLQTNLLTAGTTIGEWYYVEINNNQKEKKGPVSLDKLKELLNQNIIQETTMVWAQGMEDWKILKDITVLKWALLKKDTGILTPIELCQSISKTLEDLVTMYPSRDMHGILLRPIPRAKRILSSPRHLPHIVQLLLTAAPTIVDTAARLLKNLLEDNPTAQPKFYLTGVFYFALMYSGSNLKEISKLLYATHRQQKIGEAVELSVLKPLIPPSLITVLDRSPEEFSARLVGEVATPEIRWSSSMRSYLIDSISQHIGDFAFRLTCNPLAVYSHVPIPPIVYEELKDELYCGRVYLKQLCDEEKYPDYVINDPVGLLQAILHAWVDVAEAPKKMSTSEACQILGVETADDKQKLRKAYYKLAQKYHPDRNPEGREMFEKVNDAYNQLIEIGPDNSNEKSEIIIHSQCILYERCGEILSPYKYAGYGLLVPALDDEELRDRALELVYLTIRSSTLNVQELARMGGIGTLLKILDGLCGQIKENKVASIRYILRAMAVASKFTESLAEIKKSNTILSNIKMCLGSDLLGVVEASLECITCFSKDEEIRIDMYNRNYLGYLIHRILSYDPTLEEAEQESIHQMKNAIAGMSLLAMKELVKIQENTDETKAVFALFTPQLGLRIRHGNVGETLNLITSTTQTPYLLWTNKTRQELIDYIDAHLNGTMEWTPKEYELFRFPSLKNELIINGVYIRLFNEQIRTCEPLPDPIIFLRACLKINEMNKEWEQLRGIAICNVFDQYDVINAVCDDNELLELLFNLLKEEPDDPIVQKSILHCVKRIVSNGQCVEIVAKSKVLSKFLVLLHPSEYLEEVVPLTQSLFSVTTGLQQGIIRGGLLYLLNHFVNDSELERRVLVSQLIGKMSTTPGIGPKVSLTLSKFFPISIINTMKMDARGAVILLDSTTETPELIWNSEMKNDVGIFIGKMTKAFYTKQLSDPTVKWQVPDTFAFKYKELENELFIGGVFIRILNKNPTCPLNNPNAFSDGLFNKYQEAVRQRDVTLMDVLAKTAAVFYTNQPQCLDYLAPSGHLSKVVELLKKAPSESLFIILQVIVSNKECKEKLIDENAVPILAITITQMVDQAQLISDIFRSMTSDVDCKGVLCFVPKLCGEDVQESIFKILDGNLDQQLGSSSPEVKALIVDALQNALQDSTHSEQLEYCLDQHPSWAKYSRQKHVLYLSGAPSIAGYIAGPTTSSGAVGLLTAAEDASIHRPDAPPELK